MDPDAALRAYDAGVSRGLGGASAAWFAVFCTPEPTGYEPSVVKRVGSLRDTAAK